MTRQHTSVCPRITLFPWTHTFQTHKMSLLKRLSDDRIFLARPGKSSFAIENADLPEGTVWDLGVKNCWKGSAVPRPGPCAPGMPGPAFRRRTGRRGRSDRRFRLGEWLRKRYYSSNFNSCVSRSRPVRSTNRVYMSGRRAAIHSRPVACARRVQSRSATTMSSAALHVSARMRP